MVTTTKEVDLLVSLLESCRAKAQVQHKLRESNLHYSGDWDTIEGRIRDSIERGKISLKEWVSFLSSIEDNGYQHIFLYSCAPVHLSALRDTQRLTAFANSFGVNTISGQGKLIDMPDKPTLVRAMLQGDSLDIKWVEKRQWKEQTATQTEETDTRIKVTVEYERKAARGITVLRADLLSGITQLRIERFKPTDRDNDYDSKAEFYWKQLESFLESEWFAPVLLVRCVDMLNKPGFTEGRRRESGIMTLHQARIRCKVKKGSDATKEPILEKGLETYPNDYYGEVAQVDWIDGISKELLVKVYRESNEVLVFDHCDESDLKYVLSRIIKLNE